MISLMEHAGLEISGMDHIQAANQLIWEDERKSWKIGIFLEEGKGQIKKIIKRQGL